MPRISPEARLLMLEKHLVELHKMVLETRQLVSDEAIRETVVKAIEFRTAEINKVTTEAVQAIGVLCEMVPEVRERLNAVVGR